MWFVWGLGGLILFFTVLALREFGIQHGLQMDLANRLPGGSLARQVVLQPELSFSRLLDRIAANPVRWSLRTFFVAYFIGGLTFSLIEPEASFFDGLWWAYISMLTVGYGDFSPKTWLIRTEAYVVIFLGWSSLLIMGAALSGRIAERRVNHADATPEKHDDIQAFCYELDDLRSRLQIICNDMEKKGI